MKSGRSCSDGNRCLHGANLQQRTGVLSMASIVRDTHRDPSIGLRFFDGFWFRKAHTAATFTFHSEPIWTHPFGDQIFPNCSRAFPAFKSGLRSRWRRVFMTYYCNVHSGVDDKEGIQGFQRGNGRVLDLTCPGSEFSRL